MTEQHLRNEITEYLIEQDILWPLNQNTAILCLIAGINDYSFSDDMINDLPKFIPTEEEIKKYR